MKIRKIATYTLGIGLASAFAVAGFSAKALLADSSSNVVLTDSVSIDEKNFPDENFRTYVRDMFDVDGDLKLSQQEIDDVTDIDLYEHDLRSVKGIEFFGNLTFLNFPSENGMLTELDVSKNTKLEYLNCEGHLLTSLDVTHNPKLTSLMCGRNYIESLDLSHNPNLKEFNCCETKLSELDISKNTKLESLMISCTYITSLDLSHNASLEYVCCDLCYIDTLDVSHNPKLKWLSCSQNLLRELDVSKNLSLTYLSCRENRLSNLNVNENINLIELDCNTNAIESLDLSKNVNIESLDVSSNKLSSLDVSKCRSLRTLYCLGNTLKSLSLTENRELELLMAHYTSITSLDLRKCTKIWNKLQDPNLAVSDSFFYYEYSIPGDGVFLTTNLSTDLITDDGLKIDENVFPDPVFLEYVKKNIDKGGDGYLNDSDIAQVKKIAVSGTDVVSLKGIEYFVNLVSLNCEGKKGAGKMISLDVSPFSYLDYLNCANQPIATLNTGNNPILKTLICNDTKISSLDLLNNGNLRSLDIHHTKISSVDLKPCDTIVEKINGGDATFLNRDDYYVFEDAKGNLLLAFDPTTKVIGIDDIPSKPETPTIGDFVERLYTVALGRASEDSGKKYWVDEITSGRKTGGDCGLFFLTGAEFTNRKLSVEDFVETLYQTFFGRASEASGKAYWVGVLKNGGDRNVVVKGFIDSKEWCNLCADYGVRSGAPTAKAERASKNATDFATRLYTCCLGREAEAGGLKYWALALTNLEQTGCSAAKEFFGSAEFVNLKLNDEEFVKRLYTTFMGRDPQAGEVSYWAGEIKKGTQTRSSVLTFFGESDEFTEICAKYGIERGTM